MEMKILIIGNGFDLAHGLKTRYNDFLNYTSEFYQNNNRENDKIHDILFKDLVDNIWFEYFYSVYNRNQMRGENWIDFETKTKLSKNIIRIIGQDEYNNRMNGIGNGLELLQLG